VLGLDGRVPLLEAEQARQEVQVVDLGERVLGWA
jgi:hypothetical protein